MEEKSHQVIGLPFRMYRRVFFNFSFKKTKQEKIDVFLKFSITLKIPREKIGFGTTAAVGT
jgi:hypothetical protein